MYKAFTKTVLAAVLATASVSSGANALSEIEALKQRLAALETKLAESQKASEVNTEANAWSERIAFGGVVEVEGSYTDSDGFTGQTSSDIAVATVEFGLEANLAEKVDVNIGLLYEDDGDEKLDVDVATISFSDLGGSGIALILGQGYLPFGSFETSLVNDTLVLEIAETRESFAMAEWGNDYLLAALYTFNGDADDDNNVENYGASLTLGSEGLYVGLDYLSNIGESDGFEAFNGNDDDAEVDGFIVRAGANLDVVTVTAEYFQSGHLSATAWTTDVANDGATALASDLNPEALHVELSSELNDWTLAVAYQQTDDMVNAADTDGSFLPEQRISVGASKSLTENISLGLEVWQDEDYSVADGGTGNDALGAVVQVAVEF